MIWCALDGGTDMAKSLQLALVNADAAGIATDGKWDTLGMRATFSPSVTFTGVRVPADGMLGDPGAAIQVGVIESFALGYAAVYLGIAESALAFALDYAKKRVVKPENIAVAADPDRPAPRRRAGGASRRGRAGPGRFGRSLGRRGARASWARSPTAPSTWPRKSACT